MKPIWEIKSGSFFGWLNNKGVLFTNYGLCVGYLKNGVFFKCNGQYLGDLYMSDRIGWTIGDYHDSDFGINPENPINPPNPPSSKEPIILYGWDDIKE